MVLAPIVARLTLWSGRATGLTLDISADEEAS